MATSRVVPMKMTQMKVAQVSKPGGDFEIVEREIPTPDAGHVRIKVQACGVCHSDVLTKDACGPEFSIPAFQDTKWQASSTKWVPAFPHGRRGSVSVLAGMAARTTRAANAGAEIFAIARTLKFAASAMTVDISNTWWLPWRRWWRSRRI